MAKGKQKEVVKPEIEYPLMGTYHPLPKFNSNCVNC
jgi:hypothetical protein